MKKLSHLVVCIIILLSSTLSGCEAQVKNTKTTSAKVYGNCEMCQKTIETAAYKKGIARGEWNKDTKTLSLTFDSTKTNTDELLKLVAYAGYDNEQFFAPDEAYAKLPECCQYERPKKGTTSITQQSSTNNTAVSQINSPLSEVFSAYFALKDALTKDDGSTAAAKAKELYKAIDAAKMDAMKPEQHTVWMKYQQKLSYDAEHIKGVTETEHQREHFVSLSKNMYEVMKVFKADVPVYYQHCPMANDGKGADWLSLEEKISNPYMGKQMPTCGKTIETIK